MVHLNIRYYREQRGLTREELASKLSISHEELFDYENGYRSPHLDTAILMARELGITLADLVR